MMTTISRLVDWQQTMSCDVMIETTDSKRSINFEMKDKFNIGRYDFKSNGARLGFFKIGCTTACMLQGVWKETLFKHQINQAC